jgi:hypothetical protein
MKINWLYDICGRNGLVPFVFKILLGIKLANKMVSMALANMEYFPNYGQESWFNSNYVLAIFWS